MRVGKKLTRGGDCWVLVSLYPCILLFVFLSNMAYRPPSNTSETTNDWKFVSYKKTPEPQPKPGRWGQSALKKSAPPPKTFELEFPSLGSMGSKPAVTAAATTATTFAERMKRKLAEEEAERERLAEENRKKTDAERPILPIHSLRYCAPQMYMNSYESDEEGYTSQEEEYPEPDDCEAHYESDEDTC